MSPPRQPHTAHRPVPTRRGPSCLPARRQQPKRRHTHTIPPARRLPAPIPAAIRTAS